MTAESAVPVRLYFDADRLVVASTIFVGSQLRMLSHVVLERPVSDEALAQAVTKALTAVVPDEFEGSETTSWGPVLELFGASGLEHVACCHVRSHSDRVWATAMKPGDDGFPVVAPRGDGGSSRFGDEVWLAYELRRALEMSVNTAGERFGSRGGLLEASTERGGDSPVRSLVGAEPSSIVSGDGVAGPLRFEVADAVASVSMAEIDDEDFGVLLDELGALGLWASLDGVEAAMSRESNLKHRSWRWGALDETVRVDLDLDSMLEDDLERSLIGRLGDRFRAVGLVLEVEHRSGEDHVDVSFQGFRVWINQEPVSYGPTMDTMFRPLVLINWLADQAGIDHRVYLSGAFNGWQADSPGFDFEAAYFLARPIAELIQSTPLLGRSQRLVPVEAISGHVNDWQVR